MQNPFDSPLPANTEVEKVLLGTILISRESLPEVEAALRPEHFFFDAHRKIYARMLAMSKSGFEVDTLTLADELRRSGELDQVGGIPYVAALSDGIPYRPSLAGHIRITKDKWAFRQLIRTTFDLAKRAYAEEGSPVELIGRGEAELLEIVTGTSVNEVPHIAATCFETLDDILRKAKSSERTIGLSMGIPELEDATGGYLPGELTYVGARPGVGKTSLVIQAICANAPKGIACQFFSMEMTRHQIMRRLLAQVGEIDAYKLRKPWFLTKEDEQRLHAAKKVIAAWPVHIHDASSATAKEIRVQSKLAIRRHNVRLVLIDFFTRMRLEGRDYRLAANAASRTLAQLVKEEGVPLVCLSQLKRPEKGEREPMLSDLKETGNLEEDAHNVLLLHRPRKDGEYTHEDKIIVAKSREGALGTVKVTYDESRLAFGPRWE